MLGTAVTHGAVYYGLTHERVEVAIDAALRERTVTTIAAVRAMLTEQAVPAAANDARCRRCSLVNACLPDVLAAPDRVSRGMDGLFRPLPLARGQVMPVGDSQDIDDADGDDEPVMCGGHDGAGLNRNRVG